MWAWGSGVGGEARGPAARGGAATVSKSSGGLARRSPGEGPERGPSRAGGGAGRAGRGPGGLPRVWEARPGPPPQRPPAARPAQAPPTTRVTCAPRTLPQHGLGARRRAGSGVPREAAPGAGWGLGTEPRHRAGAPPGQADAACGRVGGEVGCGGGACREGRGLLLGMAQETGRRGRSYWLPVWAACLLLAGEL